MIEIEYNLLLTDLMGKSRQTLDIGESITLSQLEAKLGLTSEDVGMLLINGAWAPLDSVIKDGDFVQCYPYMSGG
jgi:molybdopterin converting factor small subunit